MGRPWEALTYKWNPGLAYVRQLGLNDGLEHPVVDGQPRYVVAPFADSLESASRIAVFLQGQLRGGAIPGVSLAGATLDSQLAFLEWALSISFPLIVIPSIAGSSSLIMAAFWNGMLRNESQRFHFNWDGAGPEVPGSWSYGRLGV